VMPRFNITHHPSVALPLPVEYSRQHIVETFDAMRGDAVESDAEHSDGSHMIRLPKRLA